MTKSLAQKYINGTNGDDFGDRADTVNGLLVIEFSDGSIAYETSDGKFTTEKPKCHMC
jgi:hypothetical protein